MSARSTSTSSAATTTSERSAPAAALKDGRRIASPQEVRSEGDRYGKAQESAGSALGHYAVGGAVGAVGPAEPIGPWEGCRGAATDRA